jgi:hypothetical protein
VRPIDSGADSSQPAGAGAAALNGGDGITGTFGGMTYTYLNAAQIPQGTTTIVLEATTTPPPSSQWRIRLKPTLGAQSCTGAVGTEDVFLQHGSQANFNLAGTTGSGGDCTITLTSLTPKIEGSFSGSLVLLGGKVTVTDGYFRAKPL